MMFKIRPEEGKAVDQEEAVWVQRLLDRRAVYANALSRKGLGV